MKIDTLLIAGYDSLNMFFDVARLDLLVKLGVPILIPDVVYEGNTEADYMDERSRILKQFIDQNQPLFTVVKTEYGRHGVERRRLGQSTKKPIAAMALADFLRGDQEQGVHEFLADGRTVHVLFSDNEFSSVLDWRSTRVLCITVAQLLKDMEGAGLLDSAEELLKGMQVRIDHTDEINRTSIFYRSK